MPCRQQREYLIPDLLVGHSAVRLFVLGCHQHRHQVIMDLAISSSPGDQVEDHPIDHRFSLSKAAVPGYGQPGRRGEWVVHAIADKAERLPVRLTDLVHPIADVRAEKRRAGDSQRKPHHLREDVKDLPVSSSSPSLQHGFGCPDDGSIQGGEALTRECGLDQSPLTITSA